MHDTVSDNSATLLSTLCLRDTVSDIGDSNMKTKQVQTSRSLPSAGKDSMDVTSQ